MATARYLVAFIALCAQCLGVTGLLTQVTVSASCTKTSTELRSDFRVYAKGDTLGEVYGVNLAGQVMDDACSTVNQGANTPESTGVGTDADPVTFLVRINSATNVVDSGPSCYKSMSPTTLQWVWTYRVMDPRVTVTAASLGLTILTFGEYTDYTFTCDYKNVLENTQIASITTVEDTTDKEAITENAQLTTVSATDETNVYTSVTEGMVVRLKASMTTMAKGAVALSPHFCHQCATPGCPSNMPRLKLINDNGCPTSSFVDANGAKATGFTGTGAGTSLLSGVFQVGAWAGHDFAIFSCKVDFCYSGDPLQLCTDRCAYFGGRKRREVDPLPYPHHPDSNRRLRAQQLVQDLIHIETMNYTPPVDPRPIVPSMVRHAVPKTDRINPCFRSVYFLATVNVFGVIIIASLVTTFIAFAKYRKLVHVD